jgi:hypothetical protein
MKTTKHSIVLGLFAIATLSFLLLSIPAEAYQNIHTLTSNDSVSTAVPLSLAGETLYLHAKAPTSGYLATWLHRFTSVRIFLWKWNGDCGEGQGSFPDNGYTYYHSTKVSNYVSGTGIGMLTDSPKAKIADCDTGQQE